MVPASVIVMCALTCAVVAHAVAAQSQQQASGTSPRDRLHNAMATSPWTKSRSEWLQRPSGSPRHTNLFRVDFEVPLRTNISSATLYASGVGSFNAYVNGARTNDHIMEPGTTPFANVSLYTTDDVLPLLQAGTNVLGIMLGNGWYGMPDGYNQTSKLRAVIVVVTKQNETLYVAASRAGTWRCHTGPIVYDDIYNGEHYSAALELPGWATPAFSPGRGWVQPDAVAKAAFDPALEPRLFAPIKHNFTLDVQTHWKPDANTTVFDFGREISGVCHIVVEGTHGSIALHHGEILNHYVKGKEKFVYFANLRSAQALDNFTIPDTRFRASSVTAPTQSVYTYTPHFTYHGFRFVQVNVTGDVKLVNITALQFGTQVRPISNFASDNGLLNTLHQHILWGQEANLMSYPTDCDQRDERLGWMADGWLSSDEAAGNFDMHAFYYSWVRSSVADMKHGQDTDVTPFVRFGSRPADPTWGMALPWVTQVLLNNYGDTAAAAEFYPACKAWFEFLTQMVGASGMRKMYAYYGDWVPPFPALKVNNSFVSSFALLRTNEIMFDLAYVLNYTADAEIFNNSLQNNLVSFTVAWYNQQNHTYDIGGVQSSYTLPMAIRNLVEPKVALGLLDAVDAAHNHLDTGIIGLKFLFSGLSSINRSDVALSIVLQTTYPSWAWEWSGENETAATTLWEVWNAPSQGPGMNSRNHIMDGSVDTFLFADVVGIKPPRHGDARVHIGPNVASALSPIRMASGRRETRFGSVAVAWQRHGGTVCSHAHLTKGSAAGSPVVLDCGGSGYIRYIDAATVGKPTIGLCELLAPNASCHTNHTLLKRLEDRCIGRQRCEVRLLDEDRPAHCAPSTTHSIEAHVRAVCSQRTAYTLNVTVPPAALVSVPLRGISNAAVDVVSSTKRNSKHFQPRSSVLGHFFRDYVVPGGNHVFSVSSMARQDVIRSAGATLRCPTKAGVILSIEAVLGATTRQFHTVERACVGTGACALPPGIYVARAVCGLPSPL